MGQSYKAIAGDPKKANFKCSIHGLGEFYLEQRKQGTTPYNRYRCKACNTAAVLRRKQKLKRELIKERGGACERCGYDRSTAALQFHHRDPQEKLFSLSAMTSYSKPKVWAEAEKCDLVCANCHAEIEEELRACSSTGE